MNRITKVSSFTAMINAIEPWLSVFIGSNLTPDLQLRKVLCAIDKMNTNSSIDTIIDALALSPRQVERLFRKVYGLTPKSFLRINRFQAVLARKNRTDDISWITISQTHGYFDQSHLCLEFREFTGMAPQKYFSHYLK
jgi:methylphosphotriester-DNA--protein-cysteine methyltransferase